MRRYDLMQQIVARGSFMVSKFAIPYLMRAANPHILMLSLPLDMAEKGFAPHTAYSMAKFGMSLVVLGSQANARENGSQCFVAAHNDRHRGDQNLLGGDAMMLRSRKPAILAGAACRIFQSPRLLRGTS